MTTPNPHTTPDIDRPALLGLAERCEAASGPDRRLDYELFSAFASHDIRNLWDPKEGHFYTSIIDAAVGLVERMLPGWGRNVGFHSWGASASLYTGEGSGRIRYEGFAPTEPLALLTALLRALQAIDQETEER